MGKAVKSFYKVILGTFFWAVLLILGGYYLFLWLSKSHRHVHKTIKNGFKPIKEPNIPNKTRKIQQPSTTVTSDSQSRSLNPRQQKIMHEIDLNKSITIAQITDLFPGITTRTLRRDMNKLEDKGFIKRRGSTRSTVYFKA